MKKLNRYMFKCKMNFSDILESGKYYTVTEVSPDVNVVSTRHDDYYMCDLEILNFFEVI